MGISSVAGWLPSSSHSWLRRIYATDESGIRLGRFNKLSDLCVVDDDQIAGFQFRLAGSNIYRLRIVSAAEDAGPCGGLNRAIGVGQRRSSTRGQLNAAVHFELRSRCGCSHTHIATNQAHKLVASRAKCQAIAPIWWIEIDITLISYIGSLADPCCRAIPIGTVTVANLTKDQLAFIAIGTRELKEGL